MFSIKFLRKQSYLSFVSLLSLITCSVLFFQSCQKRTDKNLHKSKIIDDQTAIAHHWLDTKKTEQPGSRNERVESLRKALKFEELYVETATNGVKVTIIPVAAEFASFYNQDKQKKSYLILTSKGGQVVRGEILQHTYENSASS